MHWRINKIYQKIYKNKFFSDVTVVATGALISQILTILSAPLLTRLYSPETIGIFGIVLSIINILTILTSLSLPQALVIEKRKTNFIILLRFQIISTVFLSFVLYVFLIITGDHILGLFNIKNFKSYLWVIPLSVMLANFVSIINYISIKNKNFKLISYQMLINSIFTNGFKIVFGIFVAKTIFLISAHFLANFIVIIIMCISLINFNRKFYFNKKNITLNFIFKNLIFIQKNYLDFIMYKTPQEIINATSQIAPLLMLAFLFGPESAGNFTLSMAVLGLPATLIANSVMTVFYPKIIDLINQGKINIRMYILKSTFYMILIGLIPFSIIFIWGPSIFKFVFGDEWHTAGVYSQIISFWLFSQFINKPAVAAIPVLNLHKQILYYEVFSFLTRISGLYLGYILFNNVNESLTLFSLAGTACYLLLIITILTKCPTNKILVN